MLFLQADWTASSCPQDFHSRVEGAVSGDDLARLLYKAFKSGHEQEDEQGAARAAQSAMCKLEIKVQCSTFICHSSQTAWAPSCMPSKA